MYQDLKGPNFLCQAFDLMQLFLRPFPSAKLYGTLVGASVRAGQGGEGEEGEGVRKEKIG